MFDNSLIAYIDPVSGTIILQVIVAGFVGLVTMFRKTIAAVFGGLFRRGPKTKAVSEDTGVNDAKL